MKLKLQEVDVNSKNVKNVIFPSHKYPVISDIVNKQTK